MKTISLKKIEVVEIEVLQSELLKFLKYKEANMQSYSDNFFDSLLIIDISQQLILDFRNRIEKNNKSVAKLNLSVSEAVVLISCCQFDKSNRSDYQSFVMQKISDFIHEHLINL